MQTSVTTSQLLKTRVEHIVPIRIQEAKCAIKEKNFHNLAKIIMQESNQLHAVCLDTFPPIMYLNDVSRSIMKLVHDVNEYYGEYKLAYTFDAGPNAFLIFKEDIQSLVYKLIKTYFPPEENKLFLSGLKISERTIPQGLVDAIKLVPNPNVIDYIIHTKVGCGPMVLESSESLLDLNGLPIITQ